MDEWLPEMSKWLLGMNERLLECRDQGSKWVNVYLEWVNRSTGWVNDSQNGENRWTGWMNDSQNRENGGTEWMNGSRNGEWIDWMEDKVGYGRSKFTQTDEGLTQKGGNRKKRLRTTKNDGEWQTKRPKRHIKIPILGSKWMNGLIKWKTKLATQQENSPKFMGDSLKRVVIGENGWEWPKTRENGWQNN